MVAADVNADTSRFASLKEGPQVRAFYRQVQALQQAPDIGLRSFELAQLRIPALHVKAVWLKDKGGTSDVVIPIAPTDPALTAGRRYSVQELLAALQARRRVCHRSHRSTQGWITGGARRFR